MVTNVADAPSQLLLLFTKENESVSPHPTLTLIKSSCPALWGFFPLLEIVIYSHFPQISPMNIGQGWD